MQGTKRIFGAKTLDADFAQTKLWLSIRPLTELHRATHLEEKKHFALRLRPKQITTPVIDQNSPKTASVMPSHI